MRKTCFKCQEEKDASEFYVNVRHSDGLQSRCKSCKTVANHQYYLADKSGYIEKARLFKHDRKEKVDKIKSSVGCKFCFEKEACCLDFHHPSDNKEFGLGSCGKNLSWERVQKEIDKCVVVCRNCHAKIHAGILRV